MVWDAKTTPRIFFFFFFFWWLASRNSIPNHVVLGSRGFNLCMSCEVCGNIVECTIHALRDCPGAKRVWTELGISSTNQAFYDFPLLEWLKSSCNSSEFSSQPCIPWKMLFPQALWLIWLQRNKVIFRDGSFDPNVIAHSVKKGAEFFAIVPKNPKKPRRVLAQ